MFVLAMEAMKWNAVVSRHFIPFFNAVNEAK